MAKKRRTLLLAYTTIALSMATMVGGSYALFTDQAQGHVHLEAGTLSTKLERTHLVTKTLGPTGQLVESTVTDPVDFTDNTTDNVFGLSSDAKIVPTSEFSATMKISNADAVAFDYWIEVSLAEKDANGNTIDYTKMFLDDQIEVTVYVNDEHKITQRLTSGFALGGETDPIGTLKVGENQTFTVTVKFVDEDNNNDAQGEVLDFDLCVYAVQDTTVVSASNN
jgi:hypothetical protein